jgi:hypothetical protein
MEWLSVEGRKLRLFKQLGFNWLIAFSTIDLIEIRFPLEKIKSRL